MFFFSVFIYNVFIFCNDLRRGVLMEVGLFIDILYIGKFKFYLLYVVVLFVFKIVNSYF